MGVYGRRAGSVASYQYSAALKAAPITWNDATLDRWLRSPPAFIPGVNMQAQVDGEQDRQNLIAYLKSLDTATAIQMAASPAAAGRHPSPWLQAPSGPRRRTRRHRQTHPMG
jgi:hypothetical protein